MENKSIEVVLCTQEEEGRELNTPFLLKRIRRMKGSLALILAIVLVVGMLAGLVRGVLSGTGVVTAMVSFAYEGVENGEDPNGAVFDINKMKAPMILEAALADAGVTDITVDELRNALAFEGVVPSDVQERIATLQTIGEKTPAALEQILEINYYPSQYKLTLNIRKLGVSDTDGKALLTAVMDRYRTWFFTTYGGATSLGESITSLDLTGYDYAEALDIIETQARLISSYLSTLQAEAPSFRSSNTGFTFSDLQSQLSILSDVDAAKLNSLILSMGLTQDKVSLDAYYAYQIQIANTELVKLQEQQRGVETAIASYQKDSILIMGTGDGAAQTTMTQTSEEYDRLFQQRTELSKQTAAQQQRLTLLQQRQDSLRGLDTAAISPAQVNAAKARVVTELPLLSEKLAGLIALVNTTADEYYETVAFKTAYQISLPAQTFISGFKGMAVECMKFAAIAAVLGILACCAVVALPPLVSGELFQSSHDTGRARKSKREESE